MMSLLADYQHIPFRLNPNIFSFGGFSLSWYATMYIVGFIVAYLMLMKRFHMGEGAFLLEGMKGKTKSVAEKKVFFSDFIFNFLVAVFFGLIVGARLGYVLFYNFSFYVSNPLAIVSPFDAGTGQFVGIYGMSYHGGLIGVIIAALIFVKKNKLDFWQLADFIVPVVPLGYFFGRLGNFFNGELYGRATDRPWGMYFPDDQLGLLRHPSQLYEAFLEGIMLFVILWCIRNKKILQNELLLAYFFGYGIFRFICEFFREPDEQIGYIFGFLTMGQLLSILMIMATLFIFTWRKKRVVL